MSRITNNGGELNVNNSRILTETNISEVINSNLTSYTPLISATGGTITEFFENGLKYRAHVFTSGTSTLTVSSFTRNASIDMLLVGGGGGGGDGGD